MANLNLCKKHLLPCNFFNGTKFFEEVSSIKKIRKKRKNCFLNIASSYFKRIQCDPYQYLDYYNQSTKETVMTNC